jgi:ornithine cyclodeaminase/alanine dehydrogenase-like protein (mu-crystallin family)
MALWLTNEDVQQVLDMKICIEELDRAFAALGRGDGGAIERYPSRAIAYMPLTGPDHQFQFRTIEGGVGKYWGIRVFPQVLRFPVIDGVRRRVAVPAADGDRFCGFLLIFDVETAEMIAGLHDGYVNWLATGATAGLGMKYQVRNNAKVAGMIGAGWFGRSVFWATYTGHPFERAKVYAPTRAHAEAFSKEMSEKLRIPIEPVASAEAAVRGSDIVICATNTFKPVLDGNWLEAGSSVVSIVGEPRLPGQAADSGVRRELDENTLRRAGVIMATSRAQAEWDQQGELYHDVKMRGVANWDAIVDLADVVADKKKGRAADDQVTVFKQNTGLGIWYAALGGRAYEEARKRGIGCNVSRDLFLEAMKP